MANGVREVSGFEAPHLVGRHPQAEAHPQAPPQGQQPPHASPEVGTAYVRYVRWEPAEDELLLGNTNPDPDPNSY